MNWGLSGTFNHATDGSGNMIWDVREWADQVRRDIYDERQRSFSARNHNDFALYEVFEDVRSNSGYSFESARDILWNSAHASCLGTYYANGMSERSVYAASLDEGYGLRLPVDYLNWNAPIFIMEDTDDDSGDIVGIYELWQWKPCDTFFKHPVLELYAKGILTFSNAIHLVPDEWLVKPESSSDVVG